MKQLETIENPLRKNGSNQGQDLALPVLRVPNSLDSGAMDRAHQFHPDEYSS